MYSTNPALDLNANEQESPIAMSPATQKVIVSRDRKHRAGKTVTLVSGLQLTEDDMLTLCKWLKGKCGCGGSVKDSEILIQGDMREKVVELLEEKGYKPKLSG